MCGDCTLKAGRVVALIGWLFWAESVLAILVTVCLAGEGVGVGLGVAFKDCRTFLDGLGAVGGGVGFGKIGGGTFFPSNNCVKTGQVKGPHCVVPGLPGAPVGPGNGAFLVMAAGGPCFFMCWARTGLGDTGGLTDLRGALSVTWPSRSPLSRRGEFSGCSCGLGCSETVISDTGRLLMVPVPFSYGTGICPS